MLTVWTKRLKSTSIHWPSVGHEASLSLAFSSPIAGITIQTHLPSGGRKKWFLSFLMSCLYHTLCTRNTGEQLNIAVLETLRDPQRTESCRIKLHFRQYWRKRDNTHTHTQKSFQNKGKIMPTLETQEVFNASMPTTGDQGQIVSKMIYLHVTKPHSLTQMAICSKNA